MIKIYQRYLIKSFLVKFLRIGIIFFSLIVILGILEEISFFKNVRALFIMPYLLTLLNAPITLFEIFPFIFLLTTQFLFYDLKKNGELNLLKKNGLSNFKIAKILLFLALSIGVFNILVYYNVASILKFQYSNLKNNYSNDNKYLAMVTDSGLWIKDELEDKILITKSNFIKDGFLSGNIINEFDKNFNLLRTVQSKKIDIKNNNWIIYNPIITTKNNNKDFDDNIELKTNFNYNKISNLFSNISTLNLFKLFSLKKDYERLGYSTTEIKIHILKLFTYPIYYGILTILSIVVIFHYTKKNSLIVQVLIGILMSVTIYYVNFIFSSLGSNGKIPPGLSILFPMLITGIISIIGLININEK
jgi:lipopolysaccharide export system permease protein